MEEHEIKLETGNLKAEKLLSSLVFADGNSWKDILLNYFVQQNTLDEFQIKNLQNLAQINGINLVVGESAIDCKSKSTTVNCIFLLGHSRFEGIYTVHSLQDLPSERRPGSRIFNNNQFSS
jgi:hypothetical protein